MTDLTTPGSAPAQNYKLRPQNYKLRSQNYKLRPQNYKLRSQNYKLRPQNYKLRSQNYKLRPQNYKLRVQNLQVWQLKLISYNFLKRCFECTVNGSLQMIVFLLCCCNMNGFGIKAFKL